MILRSSIFHCTVLCGQVQVAAEDTTSLGALFLGDSGRPSFDELKALGQFQFEAIGDGLNIRELNPSLLRDFGDSTARCSSGAGAVAEILPTHACANSLHIPSAFGFAFAQQWAIHGHVCVHGALLRVNGEGVLVVGARAAGKSVLAGSALAAGGQIVSDDYLLVGSHRQALIGERIRRFVSLRRSWAADELISQCGGDWKPDRHDRRTFLRVKDDDDRFPEYSPIDRIWLLSRPASGRQITSSLRALSHAEMYAGLVAAIQPLLLGKDFPVERDKIRKLLVQLVARTKIAYLETGQDIVIEPERAWTRLLNYTD